VLEDRLEIVLSKLTDIDESLNELDEIVRHYGKLIDQTELISSLYDEDQVTRAGWHQNAKGKLFHFDGVVWDEVPEEQINKLEYLG
jgi:hypothetical protein